METDTFLHPWTGQVAAPVTLVENSVRGEWVDEFGHLNMAHYLTICDQANWAFWNWVNHPVQTIEGRAGHEYVIVENHVTYGAELLEGDAFTIDTQLLDLDDKRMILFHRVLTAEGQVSSTNEAKLLGFNLQTRRHTSHPHITLPITSTKRVPFLRTIPPIGVSSITLKVVRRDPTISSRKTSYKARR